MKVRMTRMFIEILSAMGKKRTSAILIAAIMLLITSGTRAQLASDGVKSKGFEAGAPTGSYSLSDFEHINLYNGNLNFNMLLAAIGGRGSMGSPIVVNIDSAKWHIDIDPNAVPYLQSSASIDAFRAAEPRLVLYCVTNASNQIHCFDWDQETEQVGLDGTHLSALLTLPPEIPPIFQIAIDPQGDFVYRRARIMAQTVNYGLNPNHALLLTRLTFTDDSGNEHTLRDTVTDGKPQYYQVYDDPHGLNPHFMAEFNRGKTFVSSGGENIRFVSDTDIYDSRAAVDEALLPLGVTGYLYYPDGRVDRIVSGGIPLKRDVNGNTIDQLAETDSIGRPVTITSDVSANNQQDAFEKYDQVVTKKDATTDRTTRVYKTALHNVLRADYPSIRNTNDMFPEVLDAFYVSGSDYDPDRKTSRIVLPDGREYKLRYNPYGDLARVELPTGAAIEYDFYQATTGLQSQSTVFRPLMERRVYNDATSSVPDQKQTYLNEVLSSPTGTTRVTVRTFAKNSANTLEEKGKEIHYFYGDPHVVARRFYSPWAEGKEFRTEVCAPGGSTVLRSTDTEWENPSGATWTYGDAAFRPAENPRVKSVTTNVTEGANTLTSKVVYAYDDTNTYNNRTDEWLYDYGTSGSPGRLLKHTQTGYLKVNADNSYLDYTSDAIHIYGLPAWTKVYDVKTDLSETLLSQTETKYDEAGYAPLTYSGAQIGWTDPSTTARGNPTTSRTWFAEESRWITTHVQFDQFGNPRKSWDASDLTSRYTEIEYSPDYQYAFPTKVTTPKPGDGQHGSDAPSFATTAYNFYTGQPVGVTDEFGQTVATEYNDDLDRPTRNYGANITAPESQVEYGDDALSPTGLYVKTKKQLDATNWDESTTYFDKLGRAVKTIAKDSQGDVIVDTHYDGMGRVDRVTNPYRSGDVIYWSKTRFDEMGRAVETYAPTEFANLANAQSLGVTSFAISTVSGFVGPVVTTTDASGRKGRSITNALGQLVRVDEPTAMGGTEAVDLGALATPIQATLYTYDVFGRMVKVQQGAQNRYFKYNSLGQLIRVNQPEQEYNPNLDLSDTVNTSGHWTAGFAYDSLGRVARTTDANGINTINDYDLAGRVVKRCYTLPNVNTSATACSAITTAGTKSVDTNAVDFWYDGMGFGVSPPAQNFAKGKLSRVDNFVSQTQNTVFDNFGRVTESKQITDGQTYTSKYTYNLIGALVEEEYPSTRKVKNEYEADGDLATVSSKKAGMDVYRQYLSNLSYTASGGISQMKLGNGLWETAKFNTRSQVTELGLGTNLTDASLWKVNYDYGEMQTNGSVDAAKNTGNIAKQTLTLPGTSFVQAYTYDSLYRLKEAKETTGSSSTANWSQNFTYDLYGNRTAINQAIGSQTLTTTPSINANTNRFNTGQGFLYDKNGNVTRDADPVTNHVRDFVFNADNKQIQVKDVTNSNQEIGTYYYDGEGKRVKKYIEATGETTVFVYSSGKLVAEYSTQLSSHPAISYTTTDHLGTPRIITDALGQVKARRDFMPFGEELFTGVGGRTGDTGQKYSSTSDDLRQKFTGYQKDTETSLDFAEARMYENRFGRFMGVDPLLQSVEPVSPQTWNRYTYVLNNPLVLIDPTGMSPTDYVDDVTGRITHIDDGKDQVIATTTVVIDRQLQAASTDTPAYDTILAALESNNVTNLHLTRHQFMTRSSTVYGESSFPWFPAGSELANEMNAIAWVNTRNSVALGAGGKDASRYNNTAFASQDDKMKLANLAIVNQVQGGPDPSNGAIGWDGGDQAIYPASNKNTSIPNPYGKGKLYLHQNTEGWSISPADYSKWKKAIGRPFHAPQVSRTAGKRIGYYSTAVFGRTIFWRR